MSLGNVWNCEDWDDEPLTDEEVTEVLSVHKRKQDEGIRIRLRSKRASSRGYPNLVRSVSDH